MGWIIVLGLVMIGVSVYYINKDLNSKALEKQRKAENNQCWVTINSYNANFTVNKLENDDIEIERDAISLKNVEDAIETWQTGFSIIIRKNTNWRGYTKFSQKEARDEYLIGVFYKTFESMKGVLGVCLKNQKQFQKYGRDVFSYYINKCRNSDISDLEDSIFLQTILHPILYPKLVFALEIASYQGHGVTSYDEERYTYSYAEWVSLLSKAKERIGKKSFIEEERRKMSDSLRFRILERDGFCCKICGCGRNDGVKLEVDHIIPISKGGKTEFNNLQTLCERCNRGKSNKIVNKTGKSARDNKYTPATNTKSDTSKSEKEYRFCSGNCSTCKRDTCIEDL